MYISKIKIHGFRNFRESEFHFNNGVNVILGANNSGKSNLIRALGLILDYNGRKTLGIDDFHKSIPLDELKSAPPEIKVELSISQTDENDTDADDLLTVANWLVQLESPYEARLTYVFYLPEGLREKYVLDVEAADKHEKIWTILERDFLRYYVHKTFCGPAENQTLADGESLQKFDFQFLDAIRDVERDMLTGKNVLLREVFSFFIDYDLKIAEIDEAEKLNQIETKKREFTEKAAEIVSHLRERMNKGKDHILSYAQQTGASFNKAIPDFEGSLSDIDIYSALRLIVKYETGIDVKIPATHNGLGYNNLIFMSLLLAKMQVNADGRYLGSNAKVFPLLAIEEPEAHLHPSMQHKFLKFLRENIDTTKQVRQVFVTTHSTHIASAVSLDEVICLHSNEARLHVGYPGKSFPDTEDGKKSKRYVQRFLDATRCDMLFANRIILVEGLAEQLLVPALARYVDPDSTLEDYHVGVIAVGGRYFHHFLHLFDSLAENTIPKKVACITDRDPSRRMNAAGAKYQSCYAFERDRDAANYSYQDHSQMYLDRYQNHENIRFFSQNRTLGMTFEHDLALFNPVSMLITPSISNRDELLSMVEAYQELRTFDEIAARMSQTDENTRIRLGLTNADDWNEDRRMRSLIACRYLNSVGKGENALELAVALQSNANLEKPEPFVVPNYIRECVEWICQ